MNFSRRIGTAAIVLSAILAAGCATSNDPEAVAERQRRQEELARFMAEAEQHWAEREEEQKLRGQHEKICFEDGPVRSLSLFYNVYKRPHVRLPRLERDFLKNVIDKAGLFDRDAKLRAALTGTVNEQLNARFAEIDGGRYNTLYIAMSGGGFLGITPLLHAVSEGEVTVLPAERRETLTMVWWPEGIGRTYARAVVEQRKRDRLAVVERNGVVVLRDEDSIHTDPLHVAVGALLARAGISTSSKFNDQVTVPQSPCTSRVPLG